MNAIEMMKGDLTEQQAIEIAESGWWVNASDKDVALAQLKQRRLCMPFDVFQLAVEKASGHSVFTHQFGDLRVIDLLIDELEST